MSGAPGVTIRQHDAPIDEGRRAQTLSIRLWLNCLATQETLCVYLGIRLGLYASLAGRPATASELARRAGIDVRYAREWLEQQAVSGMVTAAPSPDDGEVVFSLPEGHREVLTDSDSPLSRVAGVLPVGAVAHALPALLEVYRTGRGLTDRDYGDDWRSGHGSSNRAVYAHGLGRWLRDRLPDLHALLHAPGAAVADIACGAGWAAIAMARLSPTLRVDGFDIDPDIVSDATRNAASAGVEGRVRFRVHDCTNSDLPGPYGLVCVFDTLHEVARPVELLRTCRAICSAEGTVLVMDAKVADTFGAPADEIERFQYTTSLLHCLPVCLHEPSSAATGTVMRRHVVQRYARDAGFADVETIAVDDRFHRLYRLRP